MVGDGQLCLFALAINIGCNQSENSAGIIPGGAWMCEIEEKKTPSTHSVT